MTDAQKAGTAAAFIASVREEATRLQRRYKVSSAAALQEAFERRAGEPAENTAAPEAGIVALLQQKIAEWRAMAKAGMTDMVPGDETGAISRWTMAEMLADDLASLLSGGVRRDEQEEKKNDDQARGCTQANS